MSDQFQAALLKARSLAQLLRLRPFDTSTAEGRAHERHRRIVFGAASAVLAKIITAATALISVPLTLNYLGVERYGLWMTISSFAGIMAFADLGIGNGLLNAIASAHGKDDRNAIRSYISSAFLLLSLVAVGILVAFAMSYRIIPWSKIFNVMTYSAQQECGPASAAFLLCFAFAIPIGIVQRAQVALQQSFVASLWQCGASLLGLLAVLLSIWIEASLPVLVLALMGTPLIVNLINAAAYFIWIEPDIGPRANAVSRSAMSHVARTGGLFFILQMVGTVAYSADNLIIAQLHGASAVAGYAVADKLFSIIPLIASMFVLPLWPAYSEANSRGDHAWIWRTLNLSIYFVAAFSLMLSLVFVFGGPIILTYWVGNIVNASFPLLLAMGVWKVFQSIGGVLSSFLNGMNVVQFQIVTATVGGIFSIVLKIFLVDMVGVVGVPWASIAAYILFGGLPITFYIRWMRRRPAIIPGESSLSAR